jgi:hypothetical protein
MYPDAYHDLYHLMEHRAAKTRQHIPKEIFLCSVTAYVLRPRNLGPRSNSEPTLLRILRTLGKGGNGEPHVPCALL